jgi:cytochrome P450 family 6
MALIFGSTVLDVGALFACLLALAYVYFKTSVSYWQKRKAPYIEPTFPIGNFGDLILMRKSAGHVFADLYKKLDGEKYGGTYLFTKPGFIFRDPDIIKDVLVKDFTSFHDRGIYIDEELEPLSGHLFVLSGSRWRNLRNKLTPTFTSGKMKMMFRTLVDCGNELGSILDGSGRNQETIEMKDILARYSTDVISSCAFGIESNSLKNPDTEFRQWGRKIFQPSVKAAVFGILNVLMPSLISVLKWKVLDRNVSIYFRKMVQETVDYRERNNIARNDFMQLLIQLKNKGRVEEEETCLEQKDHGNLATKSAENGMYSPYNINPFYLLWLFSPVGSVAFPTKQLYITLSKVNCMQ